MPDRSNLELLGFSPHWEELFAASAGVDAVPGRVVRADRGSVLVTTEDDTLRAEPSPRLLKTAHTGAELPAAGDWVAVHAMPDRELPVIEAVLPRSSAFVRGDPGKASTIQVLAANVDTVFVVHPIAEGANVRRIERELALAWQSGSTPVVVLTKADLSEDDEAALEEVRKVALDVDIHVVAATDRRGLEPLRRYTEGRRTVALIGTSGAGKSTLINALIGEDRQKTREVRASDGKGRHVTVARELVPLPGGGVLVDTPGMRALALTEAGGEGIEAAFPEIVALSEECRFRDCTHTGEPGCAVVAAVTGGTLPPVRLRSYLKLREESAAAMAKAEARGRKEGQRQDQASAKGARYRSKRSEREDR